MLFKKFAAMLTASMLVLSMTAVNVFAVDINDFKISLDYAKYGNITSDSAKITGTIYAHDESVEVRERGVAYSKTARLGTPTWLVPADDERVEVQLTELSPDTTYYYRGYVRYRQGNGAIQTLYASVDDEQSFTTRADTTKADTTPPVDKYEVNPPRVTLVNASEVQVESSYNASSSTVQYAGFVYSSKNEKPTRDDTELYDVVNSQSSQNFSKRIANLSKNTTYHVRAYITYRESGSNTLKEVYSKPVTFSTSTSPTPAVYVESVENANISGADIIINVTGSTGSPVVERGVLYSTTKSEKPNLYNENFKFKSTPGTIGTATVTLSDLNGSVLYYVWAYARTEDGTVYYSDSDAPKTFTTKNESNVSTEAITDITGTTAVANGSVEGVSSFTLVEKGFAYSPTSKVPTVNDYKVSVSSGASGNFSLQLSGLEMGETYYVRAYAKTADSISYGNTVTFTTGGEDTTIYVTYRLVSGTAVGSETLHTTVGKTLIRQDLKQIPYGFNVYENDWSYNVTGSANIFVTVTEGEGKTGAFMDGIGSYMFAPDRATTRAEVAQVFYNLAEDYSAAPGKVFTDVSASHPSKTAIDYVSSMGYMTGYPDGSFHPNDTITRAEICTVLTMVYGFQDLAAIAETTAFSDVKSSDWFYHFVAIAYQNKIFSGYPDGTFGPARTTTRAEACTIFINSEKRGLTPLGTAQFEDVPPTHWAYKYIMSASIPKP